MKLALVKDTTSYRAYVFIQDSSVTTGAGLTGLVFNSAGLVGSYVRPGAARTAITMATQTVTGAYSSGGFVEVDATNMPGHYRFDIPDAALATGVDSVVVMLKGATNMVPMNLEVQLTSVNLNDAVRAGMTALPNATAGGAAGVPIVGTGTNNFKSDASANVTFANTSIATVTTLTGHTAQTGDTYALANGATGFVAIDTVVDAILVDTAEIGAAGAGLTALATAANLATVDTVVDGIQTDLSNATDGLGAIKTDTAAILVDTGTTLDAAISTVDTVVDAVLARTLTAGPLAQLTQNLDNCSTGTASGTPTTTTMISDVAVTVDSQFVGRIITFDNDTTTAALQKQSTDITDCTAATNTLIFTALTTAPVSGDTFVIT